MDSSPDIPCATDAGLRSLQGAQSSHSGTSNYSTGLTSYYKNKIMRFGHKRNQKRGGHVKTISYFVVVEKEKINKNKKYQ